MKIESLKEFLKRIKKSRSTVIRFYRRHPELKAEVIKRRGKNYFPNEHGRYFNSEIMFEENLQLRQENKAMRNVINCLMDRDSLQQRLWYMDWSFFVTVAYKLERNKKSCFRMMHSLFEHLVEKYGESTGIRLFFSTEPFPNRNGYHNHFVFYAANKSLLDLITDEIRLYFENDRVDINLYDKFKAGIFYVAKEGLINEDWDVLGNNLGKEGSAESSF